MQLGLGLTGSMFQQVASKFAIKYGTKLSKSYLPKSAVSYINPKSQHLKKAISVGVNVGSQYIGNEGIRYLMSKPKYNKPKKYTNYRMPYGYRRTSYRTRRYSRYSPRPYYPRRRSYGYRRRF